MKKIILIFLGIVFTALTANSQTYWRYRDSLLIKGTADSITFYKPLVFPAATLQGGLGYIYGTKNAQSGISIGSSSEDLININPTSFLFRFDNGNRIFLDADEFSNSTPGVMNLGSSGYEWNNGKFLGNISSNITPSGTSSALWGDTLFGGTGSGGNLFLGSTSHATKGKIRLSDTTLVVDEANTRVGVGTSSPSYRFHAVGATDAANVGYFSLTSITTGASAISATLTSTAITATSGWDRTAVYAYAVDNPASTSNRDLHALLGKVVTATDAVDHGTLYGLRFFSQSQSTGTTAALYGVYAYPYMTANGGTVTNGYGFSTLPWATNGTFGTWTGINLGAATLSGSGAITNLRGISISDYTAGTHNTLIGVGTLTTGDWGLYINSTKANYLGGNLSIDTTSCFTGYEFTVDGDMYASGNMYSAGDVSALTFTDRTSAYNGDALKEIMKTKTDNDDAYHNTIPEFTKSNGGVDIGAMTAVLLKAVQQLKTENDSLKAEVNKLKK